MNKYLQAVEDFANWFVGLMITFAMTFSVLCVVVFTSFFVSCKYLEGVQTNMVNLFKHGFYFEKNFSVKQDKKELLGLHPLGSSAVNLLNTIKKSGANIAKEDIGLYKSFVTHGIVLAQNNNRIYSYNYEILFGKIHGEIISDENDVITNVIHTVRYNAL